MACEWLTSVGFMLMLAGFAVLIVALILAFAGGRGKGGGVILIGPFPIVFGSDAKTAKSMIYLALALIVAFTILTFILPFILASLPTGSGGMSA